MKLIFLFGLLASYLMSATWIVAESSEKLTWKEAKDFCESNRGKLPQTKDLKNAYSNKFKRYFKKDFYWSGSENYNNLEQAEYFNFYDGSSYNSPKNFKLNVRCLTK